MDEVITKILLAEDPESLNLALTTIRQGGLVAFPTDTVYGVGASAFNSKAVADLYRVKGRGSEKPIPVMIADLQDLDQVAEPVPETGLQLAQRFWPGAITLVLPKRKELPKEVSETSRIGVRVPDHAFAQSLLTESGPLAVTSANRSGEPSACSLDEVLEALGGKIEIVVDGGITAGGIPSTVVDCTRSPVRVLREGPISSKSIFAVLD